MTDLTEKWKAGELDRGKEYWCKVEGEGVLICYLTFSTNKFTSLSGFQIKCLSDDTILEVLARCDYEELQELKEYETLYHKAVGIIYQLRALLKECLPIVSAEIMTWQIRGGEESHQRGKELLTKIEEISK